MPKTGPFGKQSWAGSSPKEAAPGGLWLGPPFPRVAKRKAFMIGVNEVVSGAKSAKSAMTAAAETPTHFRSPSTYPSRHYFRTLMPKRSTNFGMRLFIASFQSIERIRCGLKRASRSDLH